MHPTVRNLEVQEEESKSTIQRWPLLTFWYISFFVPSNCRQFELSAPQFPPSYFMGNRGPERGSPQHCSRASTENLRVSWLPIHPQGTCINWNSPERPARSGEGLENGDEGQWEDRGWLPRVSTGGGAGAGALACLSRGCQATP